MVLKNLRELSKMDISEIKQKFNMRVLGGEVAADKLAKFNSLRHILVSKNPDYEKFLGTKSRAIRTFVYVFLEYPNVFMELTERVYKEFKNDRRNKSD